MISSGMAIIRTLAGVGLSYGKPYCFPAQETILSLLEKYHETVCSRRTLNRHLHNLEVEGYFKRVRRHRVSKDGKILFNSTLYKFKGKLFKLMFYLGKQSNHFFRVFRVPWKAQYKNSSDHGFKHGSTGSVYTSVNNQEKGGPSATSSGDPPPSVESNLASIQKLIKNIG